MSATGDPTGPQPSEEELRAAYEAEIKKIRVEHVLLEHVVTMVNLGMRRTGLSPGTEAERDPAQVQLAVEAVRRLLPVVEQAAPAQAGPIRDALSQLQLAFVRIGGQPAPADAGETAGDAAASGAPPTSAAGEAGPADQPPPPGGQQPPDPGQQPPDPGAGPAQQSGRLWVPGR